MTTARHGIALRSPWYIGERAGFDRFAPRAPAPAIQKYDRDDFADRIVEDPRASLQFDRDDRWSFTMPRASGQGGTLRERLTSRQVVHTPLRKLYQPSHQRFYAVTIELFCDVAGLPRLPRHDDSRVSFVVRRLRTRTKEGVEPGQVRQLAKAAAEHFIRYGYPAGGPAPEDDVASDVVGLLPLHPEDEPRRVAFEAENGPLLDKVGLSSVLEGWYVGSDGRGRWMRVPGADELPEDEPQPGEERPPDRLTEDEQEAELPMWRILASAQACERAETRSIWFGVVPTYSGDLDRAGLPRFDERATYVLQCVARRPRPAPHQHCPPDVAWSGHSRPYRLAAFFDPVGTAQRTVHVKLPDFRTLEAHAGRPRPTAGGGGGVRFERPPGSQLPPSKLGEIPKVSPPGSGPKPTGATAEICSFSIELITIVAIFVLYLFLPIVVIAFQLWWLLLLKFCWPRPGDVGQLLSALGSGSLSSIDDLGTADRATLNELLGVRDTDAPGDPDDPQNVIASLNSAAELAGSDADRKRLVADLVEDLVISSQPEPTPPAPTSLPADPLC